MDRTILNNYFKRKKVDPKYLEEIHKYREKCVFYANEPGLTRPFTRYSENFPLFLQLYQKISEKDFSGKKIIEIGSGANPLAEKFLDFGASKYVCVEPFHPELTKEKLPSDDKRIKVMKEDGLSYLLKQKDNSSLVISCGVICPEMSRTGNDDYFKFLMREIYRVTPSGDLTIHLHGFFSESPEIFELSGFKPLNGGSLQWAWRK